METLVPVLMVILIGTLALVLYFARQREELAREETLKRRIQTFVASPVPKRQANRSRRIAGTAARTSGGYHDWDPLRNLDRLAGAGRNQDAADQFPGPDDVDRSWV